MSEEQPRNAQAGQRQKRLEKERRQANGNAFSNYDLTRKNEDFMYQLNKQLDRLGVPSDKKDPMLKETRGSSTASSKARKRCSESRLCISTARVRRTDFSR